MTTVERIKSGYRDIGAHKDAPAAYADFHRMLEAEKPSVEAMKAASLQTYEAQWAADIARNSMLVRTFGGGVPLHIGNGVITIGDQSDILDVSYQAASYDGEEFDMVEAQYGPYQHIALRKLGQASLLRSMFPGRETSKDYQRLHEMLLEQGLTQPDEPSHHLGYASGRAILGHSDYITAGVSGMVPTPEISDVLRAGFSRQLKKDRDAGLVDWRGDEFAGATDRLVAKHALNAYQYRRGYSAFEPTLSDVEKDFTERFNDGQNLH